MQIHVMWLVDKSYALETYSGSIIPDSVSVKIPLASVPQYMKKFLTDLWNTSQPQPYVFLRYFRKVNGHIFDEPIYIRSTHLERDQIIDRLEAMMHSFNNAK